MTQAHFSPRVAYGLGFAGLIPFVAPAALLALDLGPATRLAGLIDAYAFGIICFLCGSWWGMAIARGSSAPLVASNLLFLLAFFLYFLAPQWWPLGAALLLAALFTAENRTGLLPRLPDHYRRMRALLTLFAALSMLLAQAAR